MRLGVITQERFRKHFSDHSPPLKAVLFSRSLAMAPSLWNFHQPFELRACWNWLRSADRATCSNALLWLKSYSFLGSVTEWLVYRNIFLSSIDSATFVHGKLGEDNYVHFAELVVVTVYQSFRSLSNVYKFITSTMTVLVKLLFGMRKLRRVREWLDEWIVNGFINWPK